MSYPTNPIFDTGHDQWRSLISLKIALMLLVVGLVGVSVLFGMGLRVRPANFPGIGIGTSVHRGTSLGIGLVVVDNDRLPLTISWGFPLGIYLFWLYAGITLNVFLVVPVELWLVHTNPAARR